MTTRDDIEARGSRVMDVFDRYGPVVTRVVADPVFRYFTADFIKQYVNGGDTIAVNASMVCLVLASIEDQHARLVLDEVLKGVALDAGDTGD